MFTVAQGKALMRSSGKRTKNGGSWNGWCGAFVYWFTGAARSFATATDAFFATRIVSVRAADAPAGAVHYWTNRGSNPRPGHVAVSLGEGVAAMASSRVTTRWGQDSGTIPVAAYNRATGSFLDYRGWSYDFGGQRMLGVRTLAEVHAAVKAHRKATPRTHTVRRNENLASIAAGHRLSVPRLVALNRAKHPSLAHDPDTIQPGWVLRLK